MNQFLDTVKKLDIGQAQQRKTTTSDEERLWLVAAVLLLSERAGLVAFKGPKVKGKRAKEAMPLPKGLIRLLEACEKQNLITINRKKLKEMTKKITNLSQQTSESHSYTVQT